MSGLKPLALLAGGVAAFLAAVQMNPSNGGADFADIVTAKEPGPARAASAASASDISATARTSPDRPKSIPNIGMADAFGPVSWLPPVKPAPIVIAAPPPPPPPLPPPTAPKLPFTLVGMVERGAQPPQVYLSKGDMLLIVAAGEVIDNNTYRVESLLPNAVEFTYLPLGTKQTLNAPGAAP